MSPESDREERIERLARWLHLAYGRSATYRRLHGEQTPDYDLVAEMAKECYRALATALVDEPPDELYGCYVVE